VFHREEEARLRLVLDADPDDPEALFQRGRVLFGREDYARAAADFRRVVGLDAAGYPEAHFNLGLALEWNDQPEAAEVAYTAFVAVAPEDPDGYVNRANLRYYTLDDLEGALADAQLALALSPGHDDMVDLTDRIRQEQAERALSLRQERAERARGERVAQVIYGSCGALTLLALLGFGVLVLVVRRGDARRAQEPPVLEDLGAEVACPSCAEEVPHAGGACEACGAPLPGPAGAPDASPATPLPWLTAASGALVLAGVVYVALGPLFMVFLQQSGGFEEPVFAAAFGVGICGLLVAVGLGNAVAAWGLMRRAKWGWVLALVFAVLYAPSACFPLGILLLYGLLREDSKQACGV
jgi:tetratricopeptide (TPR) repeat protein